MIEHSRTPMMSSSDEIDNLQRRANLQRSKHQQSLLGSKSTWQKARQSIGTPSLSKLPTRFLLHALVVLILPVAVGLGQIQPGMLVPSEQAVGTSYVDGDLAAPIAPLSLDTPSIVGDAPLDDHGDLPVPLSLVSRSEALAPVVVQAAISDRLNVRNGPGTEYDVVKRLASGAEVQVIGKYGDWLQIRERVDMPIYWVSAELVSLPEGAIYTLFDVASTEIPAPPPPKVGTVAETGLSLRDGPGTNYVAMTKLESGAQLDLLERYEDWYHVGIPGGTDGWVKAEFMSVEPSIIERLLVAESIPDPNPALVGSITDNSVNLREGPDSRYKKVGTINSNEQVDLIGKHKDWFKIRRGDGSEAWVFSDFLSTTERVIRRVPATTNFPALPVVTARSSVPGASASLADIPASGDVASYATRFVGSRYVWGGASPSGFDCSGFTSYVYRQFGVSLPHSAAGQFSTRYGASVGSMDNLAPGDLVFFVNTGGGRGITHVALYIGGGRIVHAMTPRYGVQISSIYESYWVQHYYGGIRVNR
jgi:cell wall-associated NlpC family hydrolase